MQAMRFDGTATAYDMVLQAAGGNVGIGTSSPSQKLDVSGTVKSTSSSISDTGIAAFGAWTRIQENGFFDAGGNFTHNALKTSGVNDTWNYVFSAPAARYKLLNGVHSWFTAPSGTAGDAISFTQALTLNTNGALVLQGGDTAASGVGIAFPATQVASSNANTLDDYEEGTWTPTNADNITINSIVYAVYTKIGNTVTANCWIKVDLTSSSFQLGGFPFAGGGRTPASVSNVTQVQVIANQIVASTLFGYGATTTGTDDDFFVSITYQV
jgi:hypothetical protein